MKIRHLVIIMLLLFILGGFIGYSLAMSNPYGLAKELFNSFGNKAKTIGFAPFSIRSAFLIFMNNFAIALLMIILSITIVLPSVVVFLNGAVAGVVVAFAEGNGISIPLAILSMIPHGLFELSAFFLSASYGTALGIAFWKRIIGKSGNLSSLIIKLPLYVFAVAALLLIAAFVETFISPLILTL
ncbi:MAG: stage II sporulation protein M [Fervidicoccaceae archaeon]